MSAYTHNLIAGYSPLAGMHSGRVHAHKTRAATIAARAKNVGLFFIAPFVGLAYLLAFPLVGFGMLVWLAAKAVMKSDKARPVALVIAAPVIALAFVTVGPVVALGALAAMGAKALLHA